MINYNKPIDEKATTCPQNIHRGPFKDRVWNNGNIDLVCIACGKVAREGYKFRASKVITVEACRQNKHFPAVVGADPGKPSGDFQVVTLRSVKYQRPNYPLIPPITT